jgi:hypothetical protein
VKKIYYNKLIRDGVAKNMKKKGGFAQWLWLVRSEDNGYKTNEKRGRK